MVLFLPISLGCDDIRLHILTIVLSILSKYLWKERKMLRRKEGRIGKIKQSPHQYRREKEHTLLLSKHCQIYVH